MFLPSLASFGPLPDRSGFASALRLQRLLSHMDEDVRDVFMDQIRGYELDYAVHQAVDRQLDAELQADILRNRKDGITDSLMYQMLPAEIISQIYSYVVAVEQSVHIFPPKGNDQYGFRLSLCEEANYDFDSGTCHCEDRVTTRTIQATFFHNAIFHVSRSVRRGALDAFFMTNKITFTCLDELAKFTTMFTSSCSKIQHLRLFERVDDYPAPGFRLDMLQNARMALKALKNLELNVFIGTWSAYEKTYEDGLVYRLLHFALGVQPSQRKQKRLFAESDCSDFKEAIASEGKKLKVDKPQDDGEKTSETTQQPTEATIPSNPHPPIPSPSYLTTPPKSPTDTPFPIPALKSLDVKVRMRPTSFLSWNNRNTDQRQAYHDALCNRLVNHLTDVFLDNGKRYRSVEDVPQLMEKPKTRMREEEEPPTDRRGMLFMKD